MAQTGISIKNLAQANGGVTYLGGVPYASDGSIVVRGPANRLTSYKVLLVGDSITTNLYDQGPSVTGIADNGDGTATITLSGSHNYSVGQTIYVSTAPALKYNTYSSVITAQVNSGTFTVTYTMDTTNNKPQVTGSVASSTTIYYPLRYSCIGWPAWFEFLAGAKMTFVPATAGGAITEECLTMFNAQTSAFDMVMICVGMNDIYADGLTATQIQAQQALLIDAAVSSGAPVVVLSVPPRLSSASGWSAGKQDVHNAINLWQRAYCAQVGALWVDLWRATHNGSTWVNPAATEPDPTSGFTNASDGTHPLNIGAYAGANAIPTSVRSLFLGDYIPAHPDMDLQSNVLTNSKLTGTTGTKTAGSGTIVNNVPDSWIIEIAAGTPTVTLTSPARTVSADGDADGNNLQAVFAYSGTGTQIFRLQQTGLSVTAGRTYDIEFPVAITGATGMTGIELVLFGTRSSGGNINIGDLLGTSSAMAGAFTGTLRIKDWVAPSGITALQVFARFYFTSGGATILFKKPYVRALS